MYRALLTESSKNYLDGSTTALAQTAVSNQTLPRVHLWACKCSNIGNFCVSRAIAKDELVRLGGDCGGEGKAKVGTLALEQTKLEQSHAAIATQLHASPRFAEIYSGPLPPIPVSKAPASTLKAQCEYLSNAEALRCVRGLLLALGLEGAAAAVAFCLYAMLRP